MAIVDWNDSKTLKQPFEWALPPPEVAVTNETSPYGHIPPIGSAIAIWTAIPDSTGSKNRIPSTRQRNMCVVKITVVIIFLFESENTSLNVCSKLRHAN